MGCSFDGCPNPPARGGLCAGHTKQRQRGGSLRPLREELLPRDRLRKAAVDYVEAGDLEDDYDQADDNLRKAATAFAERGRVEAWKKSMAERQARGERVGRPPTRDDREIVEVLEAVGSIRRTAKLLRCSRDLVRGAKSRVRAARREGGQEV